MVYARVSNQSKKKVDFLPWGVPARGRQQPIQKYLGFPSAETYVRLTSFVNVVVWGMLAKSR